MIPPQLFANASLLFAERPLPARLAAAAAAGFAAVECQFPNAQPAQTLAALCHRLGLSWVLQTCRRVTGPRASAALLAIRNGWPNSAPALARRWPTPRVLGAPQVNVIAGIRPADVSHWRACQTLVDNLGVAAEASAQAGVGLRLEAINSHDISGFLVDTVDVALEIIERVG